MAEVIRMPRMSDTMEEGVIVGWLKEVGDQIEPGDVLAEVETDKATMELESYQEGVLLHIGIKEGAVPVNGLLAIIGEKGEDFAALLAAEENGASNGAASSAEEAPETEAATTPEPAATPAASANGTDDKRVKASPLARSMANEAGIDLGTVKGTGDHGRIIKRDIVALLDSGATTTTIEAPAAAPAATPAAPAVAVPAFATNGAAYEDEPVNQMRKAIARHLGQSKFSAPHFYLTIEANMDKTIEVRKRLNEVAPTKISFNDLVIKACAAALKQHPAINSAWMGDTIRHHHHVNIGVAVAVKDGLVVPVIRHADMKSLSQINVEVKELAEKARTKKIKPEEMQGNTFTVSNLGMFGIEEFTAIINAPDACILAVGAIIKKAIVKDGELAIGNMMKVTLSCDHRVVDGATGAQFLQTLKGMLEDPLRLLV
ncbi:MAG: pyruvate dehydrogenase complex dihydrolipoamide acetyltransferase [Bacteroidota bacterium]